MRTIKYNGVQLELPSERPVFTHSVPMMIASLGRVECNQNIPYFEKLLGYKASELPEELLHDVYALNSVRRLNYQINNGGFKQYYDSGYHKYYAGNEMDDFPQLDITEQLKFLDKFILFILMNEDKKKYSDDLTKAVVLLRDMPRKIFEYESLDEAEKQHTDIEGMDTFDTQWYEVSDVIEWGMELYAQYLCKRLEAVKNGTEDR